MSLDSHVKIGFMDDVTLSGDLHCPSWDDTFVCRIAAKRQPAGIKFTHRPKNKVFRPRVDSLHRFRSNFAGPTGTRVRLAVQNFTSIATGVGMRPPKCQKFPLFGVKSRCRGDSLDRFLKFLGFFYTTSHATLVFQI